MTRKHFEFAAELIGKEASGRAEFTAGVYFLSQVFTEFNPRFDYDRFRARAEEYFQNANPQGEKP